MLTLKVQGCVIQARAEPGFQQLLLKCKAAAMAAGGDVAAAAKGGGHNNSPEVSPVEGCGLSVRPCLSQAALSAPSADDCGPISPSGPAAGLPQSRLSLRADHHTQTHTVIHSVFQLEASYICRAI